MNDRNRVWIRTPKNVRCRNRRDIIQGLAHLCTPATAGPPTRFSPPPSVNPQPSSGTAHARSLTPPSILDNEVRQEDHRTSRFWRLSDLFRTRTLVSTKILSPCVTDCPLRRMEAILPRLRWPQTNPQGRVPNFPGARISLTHQIGPNRLKVME